MHVTNTTPQMQAFNSPIWLALEDYALQHAREDDMKISVFTGPYFADDDPEMYGVRIPLAFWKIIAFIHDETGKLCATGYEMNQEQSLQPEEEFVFGAFTSPQLGTATQVSIRSIEARSGIDFGSLASVDPLAGSDEGLGAAAERAAAGPGADQVPLTGTERGLPRNSVSSPRRRGPITTDGYCLACCFREWLAPSASLRRGCGSPPARGRRELRASQAAIGAATACHFE